ncbi:hypothetical protein PR202_ga16344 [Eleusine coracana subsp. coracana]|uniref:Uncharacterized protein n=1 Tax=Eleusine coracana subsp. coracana TaxID=191504 RepID=A0AAV5CMK6_ELECO|nr:hypothetical protein QOZ80_6AG0529730 [Eleusine coracana subsp. coracana]GJM99257.1 hypothetical protein PR202_ga16344 [Eleusine coracana subsp. coracana]
MGSHVVGETAPEAVPAGERGGSHVVLDSWSRTRARATSTRCSSSANAWRCTVTRFILATRTPDLSGGTAVRVAAISDGFERVGFGECNDGAWPGAAAAAAAFFTQPCAVNVAYGHAWAGRVRAPVVEPDATVKLPGLPPLRPEGLPWFLRVVPGPYPTYLEMVLSQFQGLEEADDVLVNSVYELEPETIGPTVPASYLGDDARLPNDTKYGLHLFELTTATCMAWLDAHAPSSVVYASFGSLSDLDPTEMREVAHGLLDAARPFRWVVRSPESHKLPPGFAADGRREERQVQAQRRRVDGESQGSSDRNIDEFVAKYASK